MALTQTTPPVRRIVGSFARGYSTAPKPAFHDDSHTIPGLRRRILATLDGDQSEDLIELARQFQALTPRPN